MKARAPVFLVLMSAFAAAAAQEDEIFSRLDRDRDGVLSEQEMESEIARRYDWIAVDRNRDGRVTRPEFGTIPVARSNERGRSAAGATGGPEDKPTTGSGRP